MTTTKKSETSIDWDLLNQALDEMRQPKAKHLKAIYVTSAVSSSCAVETLDGLYLLITHPHWERIKEVALPIDSPEHAPPQTLGTLLHGTPVLLDDVQPVLILALALSITRI